MQNGTPCEIVDVDILDRLQLLQCAARFLESPVRLSDAQMSALDGLATLSETTHEKMLPSWREANGIAGARPSDQLAWHSVAGHVPSTRWNRLRLK